MEDLDSVFLYHQEPEENLRQKLINTTLELETTKNENTELFSFLKQAYQERDEARSQLQNLMNKVSSFVPSSSTTTTTSPINLQDMFVPKSITESSSLSHGSPPVDSFFDSLSSTDHFSNFNNTFDSNNNNNMSYLNCSTMLPDPETAIIDSLARDRGTLPQKGKLVQAVIDAGPLLQTILLAGPLPNWTNPPPLQNIKVPPLTIKVNKNNNNTTTTTTTTTIQPKPSSSSSSLLFQPSKVTSTCSPSMLNFAPSSWKSSRQFSTNSDSSFRIQVSSGKRQRHQ